MVRDLVLDAQAAKPPVGQIHLHLAAQQPLRANGEHVAEDKHSDHKNRINRGAAKVGVVGRQLTVHPRQVQHSSDLAHAMIAWDDVLKAERIEQLPLVVFEPPHHRQPPLPRRILRGESRFAAHGNRLLQQNWSLRRIDVAPIGSGLPQKADEIGVPTPREPLNIPSIMAN